ncbi:uncharacterized protein VICG_01005 [Vittaforma corneae ATCC 50505]|uniref:Uncharacterized protein n=1 Tax=Vittaforma corneae (strain ATCC 50505) TaxID=993615 RepID=L2GM68_VITCO|nr:uncharacterized protein VICG_01005 [Vittaforma corneae ATCC 50505]ELA41988.1 hypothetical protein VICG_01005 [Vittaforma corneae ATCC 50505]
MAIRAPELFCLPPGIGSRCPTDNSSEIIYLLKSMLSPFVFSSVVVLVFIICLFLHSKSRIFSTKAERKIRVYMTAACGVTLVKSAYLLVLLVNNAFFPESAANVISSTCLLIIAIDIILLALAANYAVFNTTKDEYFASGIVIAFITCMAVFASIRSHTNIGLALWDFIIGFLLLCVSTFVGIIAYLKSIVTVRN